MTSKAKSTTTGIAIGVAIGVALVAALGNLGAWLAIGAAMGLAIPALGGKQTKECGSSGNVKDKT